MTYAVEWLTLHIFGVFVTIALLLIVSQKEDTNYKSELLLTIACCLVTLVAKSIYIVGGSEETLLAIGKLEYLGKCFANFCVLLFILHWRNVKIPQWFIYSLLTVNIGFYIIIATIDHHHLYYKSYWLAPSKVNLSGYTLEISAAPIYYIYMAFLVLEIFASIGIIIFSYHSKKKMPYKLKLHIILIIALLAPMILLSLRILGILKGDDPTPLGMLISCVFLSIAVVKYGLFDPVKNAKNSIINDLNEALIVTDEERRFLFLNPMAEKLVSTMKKSNIHRKDKEIYDVIKGDQGYFDWLDHHYQVQETELTSEGVTQGYMLTVVDITQIMEQNRLMKELVIQAETANQAKSAFVSNISHEIRTPMNSIVGMTEVMLRSEHSPKEQEYLFNIQSSGQALLTIINDVLDFSKMESGKMQLLPEPYDTLSLFHDLQVTMEGPLKNKPIDLQWDIDPTLPCSLIGDMDRIRQVITNLLSNAIKYTEKGFVHLSVKVQQRNEQTVLVRYEVEDSGIGIRKEDQEILFDSFQRVDLKKNRRIEGTGLGLTISQNLVNMMGGVIVVESEYGKGSTFSFSIEQSIADATPISQSNYAKQYNSVIDHEAANMFTAEDAHILLVDDNKPNLLVAQELLRPLQLQIDTADNGQQAVQMVQQKHYDLVLMDHMMPVMDGIEATKTIRALPDPYYQNLPIIALTANAMIDARNDFSAAGMNGFVAKPIEFKAICQQLKKLLPSKLIHNVTEEEARQILSRKEIAPSNKPKEDGISNNNSNLVNGIFWKTGLKYCGSKAALKKIINVFYQTIDTKANRIEQFLQEQLIHDYTIDVHALKSSALLIGACELSELAKELEAYGKEENLQELKEKTPIMLELYRSYKQLLLPYIDKEETSKKTISADEWISCLQQIHQYVDTFDLDGVDRVMKQLDEYRVPASIQDYVEKLRVCVADVAMEDIMNLTTTMVDLLRE